MERILRFKQISEKYSLNNSVELLSKEVIDFILDKFDSWIMRKSLANYSEIHKYKPSFKSSDFPVVLFKIKTVFVVESGPVMSKSGHLNSSGRAYYDFGSNRHKMSPVIRKNGDIVSSIEIKIYVPFNKKSFNREETHKNIESATIHEITHCLQVYKDYISGGSILPVKKQFKSKQHQLILSLLENLSSNRYNKLNKYYLTNLAYMAYITSDRYELYASLSEVYSKNNRWVDYFYRIYNMNYNDVLNKIKLELKEDESNDFIYLINSLFNKYNISKNIDKIDDGIKFIYDIFDDKKEYIFHKINKSKT